MSITSGSQLDLDDGDVEQIIDDEEANRQYIVEVVGEKPIRIDHRKQYASDGTTLSAGQTHTVGNLRGKRLFAAAHAGDTSIRVRLAAADVESQPEKDVNIVEGDVSATVENIGSVGEITDPVDLNEPVGVDGSVGIDGSVTVNGIEDPQPRSVVENQNQSGITSFSVEVTDSVPPNAVPDGVEVLVQADRENADPVEIGEISIMPGDALTLAVTDTAGIDVGGSSGDAVNVLFEG